VNESILKMIFGTPIWVWVIFVYLLLVGIRAIKSRIVYIPKLFAIPLILTGLKYKIFLSGSLSVWITYLICLFFFSFLSFKLSSVKKIEIIEERMSVKLHGTYWTIIILMVIFIVKYIFGYIGATQLIFSRELELYEVGINGLFSGYFLGLAIKYLVLFKKKTSQ
jgi:hypothetical protein